MKKVYTAALLLLIAAGWTACKKSDKSTPDPVIPMGITATINGTAWAASSISYYSETSTGGGTRDYISLSGYDTSGKSIELNIYNFRNRGTYSIPQANDSAFYATDYGAFSTPVTGTSGQVVIEAVTDSTVGGTFQFTASGVTVASGLFNVHYQ